ncbi:TIGR00730 family Rossman fold protein [Hahella aquimaris]|uniref:LOG family protein n=1 Tax=Hahella sp. HNIBRBA332 TaxID=3015983 RepID=UPI00273B76FF|nr:TIGR00730 family Rossman fold protein [Hahella sp. HNIBRBA332]WLQ11340.1 TIGR00730 family Rossman fold protein [Hahella sp. HNIBRBA332]
MRIAVFCGSSMGAREEYQDAAKALGEELARRNIELVYGGGHVGLMGVIADAVLAAGGKVTGVIPVALKEKEIEHTGLTELFVVADMHERKAKMAELSDAFIAMPGGAGTLEEIFEVWTWSQLGYHSKPSCFYNAFGYYDKLLDFIRHMQDERFLSQGYIDALVIKENPAELLDAILSYQAPPGKW